MRRIAFGLLWTALAAEVAWAVLDRFLIGESPGVDLLGTGILLFFIAFAALGRRWRWLAVGARWVMALEFLIAVADRLGLLGPPGSPGVSWGNFAHFVSYTRQVNAFLPAAWAPVLAVLATVAELTLGVALAVGFRTRWAAFGAAALLLCYGVAMTISLPPAQQFHYEVFVLCTGMLALASVDASFLSIDALLRRRRPRLDAGRRQPGGSSGLGHTGTHAMAWFGESPGPGQDGSSDRAPRSG